MLRPRRFRRTDTDIAAKALYEVLVSQSRSPQFYAECGVPDTVDGRFELIALHAFLVLRRLRGEDAAKATSQALFDLMFEDMDRSLRELGAGDLGVGRRVKAMAKAFYGRIAAYDQGLSGGDETLSAALVRNLYGTVEPDMTGASRIAAYLRREAAALDRRDGDDLIAGRIAFGRPPAGAGRGG